MEKVTHGRYRIRHLGLPYTETTVRYERDSNLNFNKVVEEVEKASTPKIDKNEI